MHSFTPTFMGDARPWHVGVLYGRDSRIARLVLDLLRSEPGLIVGDNEPYSGGDGNDFTIVEHGERRDLPHVEIEIRQDLIADAGRADRVVATFRQPTGSCVRDVSVVIDRSG